MKKLLVMLAGAWLASASAQIVISNCSVTASNTYLFAGAPSNSATFGYGPLSWRTQSISNLAAYYAGKTNILTQWTRLNAGQITLNTNCWAAGLSNLLTAVPVSPASTSQRFVTLMTSNYGISCAHSPPNGGDVLVYLGTNGAFQTNGVLTVLLNPTNDLCVVKLSNAVTTGVIPMPLLPQNFRSFSAFKTTSNSLNNIVGIAVDGNGHFLSNTFHSFQLLWLRPNSGNLNVTGLSLANPGDEVQASYSIVAGVTPFQETIATGGDSSGPVFVLVNGVPALLFTTHVSTPAGPCPSDSLQWLTNNIGTDTVTFVDLSGYGLF